MEWVLLAETEPSIQAPKTWFKERNDQVSYMWRNDVHEHWHNYGWPNESVPFYVEYPVFALQWGVAEDIHTKPGELLVD